MNYLRKSSQRLLTLLFTGLLLSLPLPAFAAESTISEVKTYTVTETQLQALETKLSRPATNNEKLAADCKELKAQLAASQAALEEAKRKSEQLKTQLAELTLQSKSSECLLANANKSLQEYAEQEKRTRIRIKRQRNLAYVLLAGVVVMAAR